MSGKEITVKIRSCGENGTTSYRQYTIPIDGETSVLNALEYVHGHVDPTVSYRSSCRRGVCGACLMTINAEKRLACETVVVDGMKIDPLAGGE